MPCASAMKRRGVAAVLAFGLAAPSLAQTVPFLSEEAATAPGGTTVLEMGADFMGGEPNFLSGRPRDRFDLPLLRLVYSPADNVEMDLEWVGRVMARDDPDFGNVSDYGDVSLRAKLRLRQDGGGGPGLAARFGVTLPQTSFGNGLAPNTLRTFAQLLLSQRLGRLRVHLNAGLAIHDEPLRAHEQRDFLAYAAALERPLGERGALVAEVAGLAGRGRPGADERAEGRAGLRFGLGAVRWGAAVRRGLATADGRWGLSVGLAWKLRGAR